MLLRLYLHCILDRHNRNNFTFDHRRHHSSFHTKHRDDPLKSFPNRFNNNQPTSISAKVKEHAQIKNIRNSVRPDNNTTSTFTISKNGRRVVSRDSSHSNIEHAGKKNLHNDTYIDRYDNVDFKIKDLGEKAFLVPKLFLEDNAEKKAITPISKKATRRHRYKVHTHNTLCNSSHSFFLTQVSATQDNIPCFHFYYSRQHNETRRPEFPMKDIAPQIIERELGASGSGGGPDELPFPPPPPPPPAPPIIVPPAAPAAPIGKTFIVSKELHCKLSV